MEEYTQITLDEWMQWKEDIRIKLAETAGNFVYIGYRLKQIRDSGMYGGAADVFEFAQNEYGLGKSTVSRFIAINERYSEGGNSLELKEEYRNYTSSKLSEMLTLTDSECELITEKTTVKEIREFKQFVRQDTPVEEPGAAGVGPVYTPVQKCIIDYFEGRKETLNSVMKCLGDGMPDYKAASEMVNPSGQSSFKKGIVFMFFYDWNTGVRCKLLTQPQPVNYTWTEFLGQVFDIYKGEGLADVWGSFYGGKSKEKEEAENDVQSQSGQGFAPSVATSQQEEKETEKQEEKIEKKENKEEDTVPEDKAALAVPVPTGDAGDAAIEDIGDQPVEEQLPGQMELEKDFPEYCPENKASANDEAPAVPYVDGDEHGQATIEFTGRQEEARQDFEGVLEEFKKNLDAAYKCAGVKEFIQAEDYINTAFGILTNMRYAQGG